MFKNFYSKILSLELLNAASIIGFFIIIYNITQFIFLNKESVELINYFFIFIFIIIFHILSNYGTLKKYKYKKSILISVKIYFGLIFLIFFLSTYIFSYLHFYFILLSYFLIFIQSNYKNFTQILSQYFEKLIIYFLLMYFTSLVFYWNSIDKIVFLKVNKLSKYADLSIYIELYVPIIFFTCSFILLYFFNQLLKFKEYHKYDTLKYILIIFFLIIFFFESFSTYGFFSNYGGGSLYHWQSIIGPNQMLQQGGYLLWDTPSSYGYLNHIFIDIIPINNKWLAFYYLNGLLTFLFALIFFYTFAYIRNLPFLIFAFLLTYALLFLMPAAHSHANVAGTPATGAFRYFWVILLLFLLIKFKNLAFINQFYYLFLVYICGFLWSFESAFFVSSAILPFFLHHTFFNKFSFKNFLIFLTIPLSLIIIYILIIFYYKYNLGQFPDIYMFIETALANTQGYFSNIIDRYDSLIIHLIILIIIFKYSYNLSTNYLFFSIILSLWSVSSIYVGQSAPISLLKLFLFFIFGLFLTIDLLDRKKIKEHLNYIFSIVIIILSINFSNPNLLKHIYETLTNQDYNLSHIEHEFEDSVYKVIAELKLEENIPIYFIEKSRYVNLVNISHNYNYKQNKIPISNKILFPFYPPAITLGYTNQRNLIFKKRWFEKIDKSKFKEAYIILPGNNYEWSKNLKNMIIEKKNDYSIKFVKTLHHYEIYKFKF